MSVLTLLWLLQSAPPAAPPTYQLRLDPEASLELTASWEPAGKSLYGLFRHVPALNAPKAAEARHTYTAAEFQGILPTGPVELGAVWQVPHETSLNFLSQFHPGVRAPLMSFGEVPGTWAMLRAVGPKSFEILLRAHATFQLDDGVVIKPAQFEGRLLIGREDGALRTFTLALPARDTNMDLNVPVPGAEGDPAGFISMQADIGFVPRMELTCGKFTGARWTEEIALEDARLALRRAFYPFAALDWLPFEEAVAASRAQKKPLHLILLFGCLDDDSC